MIVDAIDALIRIGRWCGLTPRDVAAALVWTSTAALCTLIGMVLQEAYDFI